MGFRLGLPKPLNKMSNVIDVCHYHSECGGMIEKIPPQAAIMGVGAPRETVRTDTDGVLKPARTIEMTVTGDHRILDGAEVARFLQTLRESVKAINEVEAWKPKGEAKVEIGRESK